MGQSQPIAAGRLNGSEYDDLVQLMSRATRRMTNRQILDLADELHEILRCRKATEHAAERHPVAAYN